MSASIGCDIRLSFVRDGKVGYLDQNGEVIIEPRFEEAFEFCSQWKVAVARVEKDEWGVIDIFGNWIGEPIFKEIEGFDPESGWAVAKLVNWDPPLPLGVIYGFLGADGEWAIDPLFSGLKPFDSKTGLAPARDRGEHLWGLIDRNGKWVVPRHYYEIEPFEGSNGLFWAQAYESRTVVVSATRRSFSSLAGRWGLIDGDGEWVIEPRFGHINRYATGGGVAWASSELFEGPYVAVNRCGEIVRFDPPVIDAGKFDHDTGLAWARGGSLIGGKCGWVCLHGGWYLGPQFGVLGQYHRECGLAIAGPENWKKIGWINDSGEWVLKPEWEQLTLPSKLDGLAWACREGAWHAIDFGGAIVHSYPGIELSLCGDDESLPDEVCGSVKSERCELTGWLHRTKGWLLAPEFGRIRPFDKGRNWFWVESPPEGYDEDGAVGEVTCSLIDRDGRIWHSVDIDATKFYCDRQRVQHCGENWLRFAINVNSSLGPHSAICFYLSVKTGQVVEVDQSSHG